VVDNDVSHAGEALTNKAAKGWSGRVRIATPMSPRKTPRAVFSLNCAV
jgi:hypothetical protein